MAKKKLDKKSLDAEITNALLDDFDKFEHFVMAHWKGITITAVAIIIGVAAYSTFLVINYNAHKKQVATLVDAKTIDELNAALNRYPDAPAATGARLRLAVLLREKKKYDDAAAVLQVVANSDKLPKYQKYRAKIDIAYLAELAGKFKAAADKFAAVADDALAPQLIQCEAAYGAGRLYLKLHESAKASQFLQISVGAGVLATARINPSLAFWQRQAQSLLLTIPAAPAVKSASKVTL